MTAEMIRIQLEETPRYEGAVTTTPYRIASETLDIPMQGWGQAVPTDWMDRSDEARAIEGAVPNVVDQINPTGKLATRGYFNALTWLLSLAGFVGVHTTGDGVITDPDTTVIATGAHKWVFSKRSGAAAQTAQIIGSYGSAGPWTKGQGFGIGALSLDAHGIMSADFDGLVLARLASDPALTPAFDVSAILPPRRADLNLSWLASSAQTTEFALNLTNPLFPYSSYSLATPSVYRDKLEQDDARARLGGTVAKRSIANADWDAVQSGAVFAATAKWKSAKSIGATATKYGLWVDMPACQYSGITPDDIANKRRFGAGYDFWAAFSESAGYDVKFTLVNAVASIATYV